MRSAGYYRTLHTRRHTHEPGNADFKLSGDYTGLNISYDILKTSVFVIQGLAEELSREGACEKAIFPDTNIVVDRCALMGNLTLEGVSPSLYFSIFLIKIFIQFSFLLIRYSYKLIIK